MNKSAIKSAIKSPIKSAQIGVALIIGLIFLLLMSMMGLAAMQSVTIQERIGGNSIDNYRAFQGAEVALAGAEQATERANFKAGYVRDVPPAGSLKLMTDSELLDPANWVCNDLSLNTGIDDDERKLCVQNADYKEPNASNNPMVKYEKIGSAEFRITVWAQGEGRSKVMLQSFYIKN
ncbi:MAG: hypothetical protein OFPI_11020 [Osedax symbiont Rs2]|nr:MAG: hypothetical protein OFPII_38300 [Osedax symbiont Rs1]EPJ53362.1 MAG: hypothetical protein OFPI_11020 [Osedax symbiont Rs2]